MKIFVITPVFGDPLEIEFTYSPGTPDVHYLRNGDPGYPGEPPEVDWTAKWNSEDVTDAIWDNFESLANNIDMACEVYVSNIPEPDYFEPDIDTNWSKDEIAEWKKQQDEIMQKQAAYLSRTHTFELPIEEIDYKKIKEAPCTQKA